MRVTPGPGHYPLTEATTKSGVYFLSKFSSSKCRRFGSEERGGLVIKGTCAITPGPGSYRSPSEFGEYQAQEKYIKESEKMDKQRYCSTAIPKARQKASHHTAGMRSAFTSAIDRSLLGTGNRRTRSPVTENDMQSITKN